MTGRTNGDDEFDTVYVLPFFAKPGKHNYMVKYKDTKAHDQRQLIYNRLQLTEKQQKSDLSVVDSTNT